MNGNDGAENGMIPGLSRKEGCKDNLEERCWGKMLWHSLSSTWQRCPRSVVRTASVNPFGFDDPDFARRFLDPCFFESLPLKANRDDRLGSVCCLLYSRVALDRHIHLELHLDTPAFSVV